jgi:hypothetical protein
VNTYRIIVWDVDQDTGARLLIWIAEYEASNRTTAERQLIKYAKRAGHQRNDHTVFTFEIADR